jgi:hypothetical protein
MGTVNPVLTRRRRIASIALLAAIVLTAAGVRAATMNLRSSHGTTISLSGGVYSLTLGQLELLAG